MMMRIRVEGRQPLRGTYRVSGNSNAAMALIAASLLTDSPVTLQNVPNTASVSTMLEVGASLGLRVQHDENALALDATETSGRRLECGHTDGLTGTLALIAPRPGRRSHARRRIDSSIRRLAPHLTRP